MVQSAHVPYAIGEGDWTFTATNPDRQAEFDAEISKINDVPNGFHGLFTEIYDVLNAPHKAQPSTPKAQPPNLTDARQSIELITAIYQASRNNQVVDLPLDVSSPLYEGWVPDNIN